jgi:hypothetical protein
MNRRRFLLISLAGVGVVAFEVGCESASRIGVGASLQLELEVLRHLFAPELVTVAVVDELDKCDQTILSRLDLDRSKILALPDDADAIARQTYGVGFLALSEAKKESVIGALVERPERLNTYRSLRNLLFADPKYGVNQAASAWKALGYQSFEYAAHDAWQSGIG